MVQLKIHQKDSLASKGIKYDIFIDNVKIGTIRNGNTMTFNIPPRQCVITFDMIGASLFDKRRKNVVFYPEFCKRGILNIEISTHMNALGILTMGIFRSNRGSKISVNYE